VVKYTVRNDASEKTSKKTGKPCDNCLNVTKERKMIAMNMNRKAVLAALLAATLVFGILAGCAPAQSPQSGPESSLPASSGEPASPSESSSQPETDPLDELVAAENMPRRLIAATLKGPTGIGMVNMLDENYNYYIEITPDEVAAEVISGEVDIACVPVNLAATLYNKTEGGVVMAAVNTLGVLYIVGKDSMINSFEDLRGKKIYATGQGSTPEYALDYLLRKNGLEPGVDIEIEYLADHAELAALAISEDVEFAMLPEPYVTQVTSKNSDVIRLIDIAYEWDKVTGGDVMTQGCVIVNREVYEQYPNTVKKFLRLYKASTEEALSDVEGTAELCDKYTIMTKGIAKKAIPNCNIVYIDGERMKQSAGAFLSVLYEANPKSVGGKMPDDDFYAEFAD